MRPTSVPGLAKATLAGEVDGVLRDASHLIEDDAELRIITGRDPEGLDIIRHSTAHLMAQAVERLYPESQCTIGPVIEDGFFYDFSYPPGFTMEDLDRIAAEMRRIVKDAAAGRAGSLDRGEGDPVFSSRKKNLTRRKSSTTCRKVKIFLCTARASWVDLCRGPHVPDTGRLGEFKLTKLAGAYWRGNSDNEMLQRIYGTAWANKKDLKAYLHRLEEAEKRDHRRLGKQLDLFHFQEEAPGMVFWHDKGWRIYTEVQRLYSRPVASSTATRKSTRRKWWTSSCGRNPVTRKNSSKTCLSPSRKTAPTRSSR